MVPLFPRAVRSPSLTPMRKGNFVLLAGVTAVAVAVAVAVQPSSGGRGVAGSGKLVVPDLAKSINDAQTITIARKKA